MLLDSIGHWWNDEWRGGKKKKNSQTKIFPSAM
jgi:hypothetical protein